MQLHRFNPNQVIIREQDQLTGIYLINRGTMRLQVVTSLYEEYVIAKLGEYCSYGAYSFFAPEDSKGRKSRFTLVGDGQEMGEYYFIPYRSLDFLCKIDKKMKSIHKTNVSFIKYNDGMPPWCDFKIHYLRKQNQYKMFRELLKRIIILNKQKRSKILELR